jgi:tetratricopeptide (TPR) repeat protein
MNRLKTQILPGCVMLLLTSGCVSRTANVMPKPAPRLQGTVKPSSLSDYIRGVYKLSAEASQQLEQRSALLADAPELEAVVKRVEQDPQDAEARSRLVAEYMSRKLYWGAYELLTNALPGSLNDPETNLNLAEIWDAWGLHDLAMQYAERAISNGATSAHSYETIGRIELHRNHPTEALLWYRRSLERTRTAPVLANIGFAHMLNSEWESARASLEEATQLDDKLEEAHNNLAIVLSKTGDETGALNHLLRTSRPAVAFNNMGVLYLQSQQPRDAQHYFEKALHLEPNYEVARRNLTKLEALLPSLRIIALPIIELPAYLNEPASPQTEEVHLAVQPQAAADDKTANIGRDEAGTSFRNWPSSHLTGVKR